MGGGGQSSQTQSSGQSHEVKQIQLPAWVEAAGKANYERAQGIADKPYEGYEGTVVPEFTGLTTGMLEEIVRQSGMFNNYFDTAGNYLAGVMRQGGAQWSNADRAMPGDTDYGGSVRELHVAIHPERRGPGDRQCRAVGPAASARSQSTANSSEGFWGIAGSNPSSCGASRDCARHRRPLGQPPSEGLRERRAGARARSR